VKLDDLLITILLKIWVSAFFLWPQQNEYPFYNICVYHSSWNSITKL